MLWVLFPIQNTKPSTVISNVFDVLGQFDVTLDLNVVTTAYQQNMFPGSSVDRLFLQRVYQRIASPSCRREMLSHIYRAGFLLQSHRDSSILSDQSQVVPNPRCWPNVFRYSYVFCLSIPNLSRCLQRSRCLIEIKQFSQAVLKSFMDFYLLISKLNHILLAPFGAASLNFQ